MNDLHARPVAVVAGASRGLGLIVATELARRGHRVAICARSESSLASAAEAIVAATDLGPADVHTHVCDVTDEDEVRQWIEVVESDFGPVEVAIHVAGVIQVGPVEAATTRHFHNAVDTMLWGPINLAFAVLPGMRQRNRGRIGVVTSIGGKISPPRLLPYSTAKFGAVGFTEGLAVELAGTPITATALVPGLMRTGSSNTSAMFFGDAAKQYAWFGPAGSLPVLSMDAERAATKMVAAVLAGKPVALISVLSHVATRVHGLAPNLTVRMLGLVSRLLPRGTSSDLVSGEEASASLPSDGIVAKLMVFGNRAARRFNQR